jgi:hypothetical protein
MDGEVDAGGCLWLGFRSWSMHRAHDVTEGVETRSGGPFLTAVLHTAADRKKLYIAKKNVPKSNPIHDSCTTCIVGVAMATSAKLRLDSRSNLQNKQNHWSKTRPKGFRV